MGRRIGAAAIAVGAVVAAVALGGIVDGRIATEGAEFLAALAVSVLGVVSVGWGVANYLGAGARI